MWFDKVSVQRCVVEVMLKQDAYSNLTSIVLAEVGAGKHVRRDVPP